MCPGIGVLQQTLTRNRRTKSARSKAVSISERVGVPVGVLAVLAGLEGIRAHGPELSQLEVVQLEFRQIPWLALANDLETVNAFGVGYRGEASKTDAEEVGT